LRLRRILQQHLDRPISARDEDTVRADRLQAPATDGVADAVPEDLLEVRILEVGAALGPVDDDPVEHWLWICGGGDGAERRFGSTGPKQVLRRDDRIGRRLRRWRGHRGDLCGRPDPRGRRRRKRAPGEQLADQPEREGEAGGGPKWGTR